MSMKNKLLVLLISILCVSLLMFNLSHASGNVNIVVSSQTPDPVKPGNFVDVSIKVTNMGSRAIQDTRIEVVENRFVSLAASQEAVSRIGAIPAFSSQTDGFVVVRKRLFIDEMAPIGEQMIRVNVRGDNQEFSRMLPIIIQESRPSLDITVVGSQDDVTFHPGEIKPFRIELGNSNALTLQNVRITMQLSPNQDISGGPAAAIGQDSTFFITQGSNTQRISSIPSQESREVIFNLGASPNAQIRPYQVPLLIEYQDVLGNQFSELVELSIIVNAEQNMIVAVDRIDRNQVTFGIANPGPGIVRGAVVTLFDAQGEELGKEYIGNLNADDFQTSQFQIRSNQSTKDVRVLVEFGDGFFTRQQVEQDFTLQLPQSNTESSGALMWVVIILVVVGGGVYFYRRRKPDDE